MPDKQAIEIPVVRVAAVEVSGDPTQDALVTFITEADTDIVLRLPPTVVAELEAMLARASLEQAKRLPKQ
ncbi:MULTISPECIES: hypothetical protein [unclassified Bosea (in: a-proteobacteria)]|uniref:hypothetical protein n=1 Tax=unclassified Bosea (in: a-proteobacteria) TaxID=2653178 RepID=UPI000F75AB07|nr:MULTISPECIES: hypothetical protein [unclassified Bosea (in: a-proteobacteria)]AZO82116.1 hypothetical protein BLM15_30510 [Bosea sp. Tri-49]RXT15561.1 hypothetical protein B5U98_31050 [Bosea sp. Tri-39]RXT34442.1 hypothetical protein B5U99_18045 [Bosea sp. Tri-54]